MGNSLYVSILISHISNGEDAFVETICRKKLPEPIQVYNFEVEDFHTYFVGKNCILVHNLCTKRAARRAAMRSENIPMSQRPDYVKK